MSFNAIKLMKFSREVHKWGGLVLSVVFLLVSVSGLLLIFKDQLGFQPGTEKGEKAEIAEFMSMDELVNVSLALGFEDLKTIEDINRIDVRLGKNVAKFRTESGKEIQIELSTGKILNVGQRTDKLLENIHDGSFFGDWFKYIVVAASGVALILLTFSGFYIWGYPLIKRMKTRKRKKEQEKSPNSATA